MMAKTSCGNFVRIYRTGEDLLKRISRELPKLDDDAGTLSDTATRALYARRTQDRRGDERMLLQGRYEILDLIGSGNSKVYKTIDISNGEYVAAKHVDLRQFMPRARDEVRERLSHELYTSIKVRHVNTIRSYGLVSQQDSLYLIMELADTSLQKEIERGIDMRTVLSLAIGALEGLNALHTSPEGTIIHRDIKPSNILIKDGQAKLCDFGISKLTFLPSLSVSYSIMGTLAYLPPEAYRKREYSPRTDIYSLGVVIYESVTGHHPYEDSANEAELIDRIVKGVFKRPAHFAPVSGELESLVMTAMALEPDDRFQTPLEMSEAVKKALGRL